MINERPLHVGISVPPGGTPHIVDVARSVERAGLDGVWSGDHLVWGPHLDSPSLLAAAAAATERVTVGWSVFLPALRPAAWAAKQVATVQQISRGRLQLGVGLGPVSPEWRAAGTSATGRAARTDAFLAALPDLLAGRGADVTGDGPTVTLEPAVPAPPLWIGGTSDAALARALRFGAGWLSSMIPPAALAARVRDLTALAGDAPVPRVATMVFAAPTERPDATAADPVVAQLRDRYRLDAEAAASVAHGGAPEQLAEAFAAYRDAGADTLVVVPWGADPMAAHELVARARALLR